LKFDIKKNPRKFKVGLNKDIVIEDCGNLNLDFNQQITFLTNDNKEYDVCRKSWGFYATPSVNSRLLKFDFKTAIVKNSQGNIYVMIVEKNKIEDFYEYLDKDKNEVIEWLDEK